MRLLLLLTALAALVPAHVRAADGRIEINQAVVEAAGGFPFAITEPGSYVLTGDLLVGANTTGIRILAPDVTLDLNGFRLQGPAVCSSSGCAAGSGFGVAAAASQAVRTTLHDGAVRGFGVACVFLFQDSKVEGLTVSSCGVAGIAAGEGSLVLSNRVHDIGGKGLSLTDDVGYGLNSIRNTGLADSSEPVIDEGFPIAGNVCDGPACRGRRRFYMTRTNHTGQSAPFACATGFHMASLPELVTSGALAYDPELGKTGADSGSGVPFGFNLAWVRTGASTTLLNCQAFTSTSGDGPVAFPSLVETEDLAGIPRMELVWRVFETASCASASPVWCVED